MKQLLFLVIAISVTTLLHAQDSATIKFSFNHLALSVKDVNRSAAFYASVLKLPEIVNRTKIEGIRWFVLADGKELHLISINEQPRSKLPGYRIQNAANTQIQTATPQQAARNSFD